MASLTISESCNAELSKINFDPYFGTPYHIVDQSKPEIQITTLRRNTACAKYIVMTSQ